MATPEDAITAALGITPGGVLAWTNVEGTGQLKLIYDGECGISSENITVLILNAHADE